MYTSIWHCNKFARGRQSPFSSMIQHLLQSYKRLLVKRPKADLHGTIFAYNCCMGLAHVMSATRIVSSNVPHLHNMKNVVGF